jgi:hypothetical protein
MPYWRTFLPWNLVGAAVWAPGCVLLGYGFSASLDVVGRYLTYGPLALIAVIAAVIVGRRIVRRRRSESSPIDSPADSDSHGPQPAADSDGCRASNERPRGLPGTQTVRGGPGGPWTAA